MANYSVKDIAGVQFVVFEASKLSVGSILPFDVCVYDKDGPSVLFNKGMVFSPLEKAVLAKKNITTLYARAFETTPSQLEQYLSGKQRTVASFLEDAAEFEKYAKLKENSFHIDKSLLPAGSKVNFNLFLINRSEFSPVINAAEGAPFEIQAGLQDIQGDLSINKAAIPLYLQYLSSTHSDAGNVRPLVTRERARATMKKLLDNPLETGLIKQTMDLAGRLIEHLVENNDSIYSLLLLKNNDFYDYTHVVNTATLSIGLGIAAGLNSSDLEKLGIGAMLHDIGKSSIPKAILNKQGKLNQTEYMVFQGHVLEGFNILNRLAGIPSEALTAVMQHHEKLNGRGYPYKLKDKDVKMFGRITAVADAYDAMVTARPFRPAQSSFQALSQIAKETGNYDPNLLKLFIRILAKLK